MIELHLKIRCKNNNLYFMSLLSSEKILFPRLNGIK